MPSVLVVDDKAVNRTLLADLLEGRGYSILEADRGDRALEIVRSRHPDVVICDIYMPVMDGVEFVRQLRADPAIEDTRVIFWSATYLEGEAREMATECGADGVLPKECLADEMGRAIEWAIGRGRPDRGPTEPGTGSGPYFRSLVEQLPGIVYHLSVESPPRIFYISPRVEEILGYPRSRWLESPGLLLEALHEDDRAAFADRLAGLKQLGDRYDSECRFRAADGRVIWFRDDGIVIGKAPSGTWTVQGVLHDVTERRKMEMRLNASQRMEALGQLAGGVAHDFNNLVTVIAGYAEFILGETRPGERVHEDATVIASTTERARDLTRQLLAFSRKQARNPVVFDLNHQIAETEKMVQRLIGEHIAVTTELASDACFVEADPGHIDQVLLNLIVNARDAMPSGGKIAVSTARVELSGEPALGRYWGPAQEAFPPKGEPGNAGSPSGPFVRIRVADTGFGMDEETAARIFEPFYTTKEKDKGTGLGLATVLGIVQQSGGYIEVDSHPGEGTRFDVYLPRVSGERSAVAEKTRIGTPDDRGTVLVVDDDDRVREVFRRTLGELGYDILLAENGEVALRVCKAHPGALDLVISDVVMPELGGVPLSRALHDLFPGLPVLFVSGYTDETLAAQGLPDADIHFMNKPIVPDELVREVRAILASSRTSR